MCIYMSSKGLDVFKLASESVISVQKILSLFNKQNGRGIPVHV